MSIVSPTEAVTLLNQENVVAIPTETVYGLAAKIDSPKAVNLVFTTKQRPSFDPLIVHVKDATQAQGCASAWNSVHKILADSFWPGPLTLVVSKASHISDTITAGLSTVGLRCPNHPIALQILTQLDAPLAAPSANQFSKTSPTQASHVESEFSSQVAVVDGGPCQVGLESTICFVTEINENKKFCKIQILRRGAIVALDIEKSLLNSDWTVQFEEPGKKFVAPGQLKVHYQPAIPLVLVKDAQLEDSQVVALLSKEFDTSNIHWLKIDDKPEIAARHLYAQLRTHGQAPNSILICRWNPNWQSDFWKTIEDRLSRAAIKII